MEIEQLKVIAKGMLPHEQIDIEDGEAWIMNYPATTPNGRGYKILGTQFNPLEDNNQMVEIMERLRVDVYRYDSDDYPWRALIRGGKQAEGLTINEAVCNAAYEYFSEDKQ